MHAQGLSRCCTWCCGLWTDMVPIFLLLRGLWIQGANAETFYYMVPVTPITIVDMVPITPIRRLLLQMSLPHHSFYFLYARTQSKFQAFICNHYLALSIIICEQYHLNVTNMISQYLKALSCDDNSMLCA